MSFYEASPHEPSGGIIREWEVNGLVEELKEILFRAFLRLTGTSYDGDPGLFINELGLPFRQSFLNSCRIRPITALLFLSLALPTLLRRVIQRTLLQLLTLLRKNRGLNYTYFHSGLEENEYVFLF